MLALGGLLGSVGTVAAIESSESNVESEDGWPSARGNPGNNAYFPDRSGPEAPVAIDWERDRGGPVAVRDGTVYQTTDEEVHALDAEDGSVLWESDDVGASGTPAIDSEHLYVGGDLLTALNADDGTIHWQADGENGTEVTPPNVYDGDVYALSGATLYAFGSDGEQRWSFEAEEEFHANGAPPVADGAVFACSESYVFARELESGTERWTSEIPDEMERVVEHDPIIAAEGYVAVAMEDGEEPYPDDVVLYDSETGEGREWYDGNIPATITEDRIYTNPTYGAAGYERETGDQVWDPDQPIKQAQQPVVAADGIYVGIDGSQEAEGEDEHGLFVFDEDGSVKWSVVPDVSDQVARLDATLVEGTVYGWGTDRLLAIRAEAEVEEREDDNEEGEDEEREESRADEDEADDDSEQNETEDEETDDDGNETEPGAADDSDTDGEDDGSDDSTASSESEDDVAADDTEADDEGNEADESDDMEADGAVDDDEEAETGDDDANDDDESTPGFTVGAGVAGGALGLEWLRRRATAEEEQREQ
jgi:outer membrane protein assembly factor BamB